MALIENNGDFLSEEKATFAGGCFWCMEAVFDSVDGVIKTVAGYAGGGVESPSYEEVCTGETGHAEALQVSYDPKKVSYEKLLEVFWHNIDPSQKNEQFCDVGTQYRSAIFYHNQEQKNAAEESVCKLLESKRFVEIYTEIVPLDAFYVAEEYHQNYYQKNPIKYKTYRLLSGRDDRLNEIWPER